jgi:hypothetical protein
MMFSSLCFAVVMIVIALGVTWIEAILATKLFHIILNGPILSVMFIVGVGVSLAFFHFLGWYFFGRK